MDICLLWVLCVVS